MLTAACARSTPGPRWRIRAFGTTVACLQASQDGPALLLAEHLHDSPPVLVYRVDSYAAAVAQLRELGVRGLQESGIPHGPLAVFETADGQRLAVYELTRPEAQTRFEGRFDP